jgi:transposase
VPKILSRFDAGTSAMAIATALGVSEGYVYGVLRRERPNRKRKPRRRTSQKPKQIQALAKAGADANRIAKMLGCSKAYVYRWMP